MSAGLLQSILERLDRLEQLYSSPPGEALSPNYLTIDPETGLVSATFTGFVQALGLQLAEGVFTQPEPENAIVWQRANGATDANGNDPGRISTVGSGPESLKVEASAVPPNTGAMAALVARAVAAGRSGQVSVQCNFPTGPTSVDAVADNQSVTIIDGSENSNFVRIPFGLGALSAVTAPLTWNGVNNPQDFNLPNTRLSGITAGCVTLWGTGMSGFFAPVFSIVDISNPAAPVIQAFNPPGTPGSGTRMSVSGLFWGFP